ncbi:hypothetical protein BN137_1322 [Cronobacter condimenti 1330]|uniref:Uncharacterized protein n=1 Tax=Cronobacter condimenti 1330 TaxID=1073999 RepID=K8A896_9ENTR|nr:hypothetical protein BN137_1322 [Cronobacter condimenti 1330]
MISLFGITAEIATGARMCRVLAFWTMEHVTPLDSQKVNK